MENKKLMIPLLLLYIVSQCNIIADTIQEEERARMGEGNEAYITSRQEEIERMNRDYDAYFTSNQEERERMNRDNDARDTSAAERAARN